MLDEVHERAVETDLLMALLKDVVKQRKGSPVGDLKVVIMSATLDVQKFQAYFPEAGLVAVPGVAYPMQTKYLAEQSLDTVSTAVQVVKHIHENEEPGDILVFVTDSREIAQVNKGIKDFMKRANELGSPMAPLDTYALHGKLTKKAQDTAAEAVARVADGLGYGRKVIVGTNVAETSVTIDGLRHVVDTCYVRGGPYDPRCGRDFSEQTLISKSQAKQRLGRGGRTAPGTCWRLMTEQDFEEQCPDTTTPAILTQNAIKTVLTILSWGKDPLKFRLMDPMSEESLIRALEDLEDLGCIDASQPGLNNLGRHIAQMSSLEPREALMLYRSAEDSYGCSSEIATILAMQQATERKPIWDGPDDDSQKAAFQTCKKFFSHPSGDHISLLTIYTAYRYRRIDSDGNEEKVRNWCRGNFLDYQALQMADDIRAKLCAEMRALKFKIVQLDWNDPRYFTKILRALCLGHFMQAACLNTVTGEYVTLKGQLDTTLAKSVTLGQDQSYRDCVIYGKCTTSAGSTTLSQVSWARIEWLVEACPYFFNLSFFKEGLIKAAVLDALSRMTGMSQDEFQGPKLELKQ